MKENPYKSPQTSGLQTEVREQSVAGWGWTLFIAWIATAIIFETVLPWLPMSSVNWEPLWYGVALQALTAVVLFLASIGLVRLLQSFFRRR